MSRKRMRMIDGKLPPKRWLKDRGYSGLIEAMNMSPELFRHIPQGDVSLNGCQLVPETDMDSPLFQRDRNIAYLNRRPMEQLRFRDFAELKSGRDQFSKLKLPALKHRTSSLNVEHVEKHFADDKRRATCLRWILRGLEPDRAVRKAQTDNEVTMNAIAARIS